MQYYHAHILVIYKLYQYSVHMQILQDDPSWEHGVKDNGATAIEHSAVLPKQACSDTAVDLEKQHQQDQNEVQTILLEEDGENDSAELTEVCFWMPPLCSN